MANSQFLKRLCTAGLTALFALAISPALIATAVGQGNITIFGRVSLPDGKPASRVPVKVEMSNGLKREILTDENGRYEIRGLSSGRYQVSAINPGAPEQYSERAESDS